MEKENNILGPERCEYVDTLCINNNNNNNNNNNIRKEKI